MLILNETAEAERIIKEHKLSSKPMQELILIARYHFSKTNSSNSKVRSELLKILSNNFDDYNSIEWNNKLDSCIKIAKNHPLKDIDYIPITMNEINRIMSIKKKKLEKLAFTVLVISKYYNIKNQNNNNYVNEEYSVIFKQARVTATIMEQPLLLNDLKQLGLIEKSKNINNNNFNVKFIDDNSQIVMKITDLRELGYTYLEYIGEHFIHCAECGVLLRPRSNKQKYCKSCASYQPIKTKLIICCDCGKKFKLNSMNTKTKRCIDCQNTYIRDYDRVRKQNSV